MIAIVYTERGYSVTTPHEVVGVILGLNWEGFETENKNIFKIKILLKNIARLLITTQSGWVIKRFSNISIV